ncbi:MULTISPECIES: non-homologous end-joining DNA ligase [Streptomyces]|uniref:non-homologous end-joining DNA ligase n=1 Tax=Streptomyces lycopersici TaxID=2974589 RepID=UPI0021CDFF20|nr:non-homologous end-joining DNA ligase [Streptomyces sp. NEAU-383]
MSDPLRLLSASERDRLRPVTPGRGLEPMLATLTHDRFSDEHWLYERKFDGERCLARCVEGRVELLSRNGRSAASAYPEVVDALRAQAPPDCVLDGEVVAFDRGRTSFARLQPRIHLASADRARRSGVPVYYYVFDVQSIDGADVTGLPLRRRKALLRALLTWRDPLRLTAHRNSAGEAYFRYACEHGWEGLIAKRADAPYAPGRSSDWLKFKCEQGQEMVIGGWTEPQGTRSGLGALLLGYYTDQGLRYAGKVGTGFDTGTLQALARELRDLSSSTSPFTDITPHPGPGTHWARPELVAEIAFTEWTRDGRLRHPRYKGLRRDKSARDVVREGPDPDR